MSRDFPPASAAATKARLVRLFEPGGRTRPDTGPATGWISRDSMRGDFPEVAVAADIQGAVGDRRRGEDRLVDRTAAD